MLAVILLTLITVASGENKLHQQQWVTKILYDTLEDYVPNGNSTCKRDGLVYRDGLKNLKLWATQMYDASAKFPTGILSGKSFDFGDYDECLETNTAGLDFKPQYCVVNVRFKPSIKLYPNYYTPILPELSSSAPIWEAIKPDPNPIKVQRNEISVSVCIPSSCTHSDLQSTLSPKIVSAFYEHKINTTVSVDPLYCTTQHEESPITLGFIIFWCFISIIIMLIIVGSLYDVFSKKDADKIRPKPIIVAFSIPSNLKRLFYNSAKTAEFSGINFLKVLSCVIVIFGHRSMYISSQPLYNINKFEETFEIFIYGIVHNGPLVVDIFFIISGFLMYLGVYSTLVKSKRLNMPLILFWRWCRLIPLYGVMIGVHSFVLLHLANGPLWKHMMVQESENCRENWWTNIMFINNYVNADRPCMIQSWYLACDLHLFILGMLIVYFVWKYPKCEKFVLLTATVVSCLIPAYIVYKYKFYPTFVGFTSNTRNPPSKIDFTLLYVPTHARATPYFVGIFTAYIYRCTKAHKPDFRFTYPTMRLCALFFTAQLWMMTIFYFFVTEYNVWTSVAYALTFRLIFATFVATFILISTINTSFRGSWSLILAPLSRLTYGAYLGGLSVQLYHVAVARTPTYFNPILLSWTAIGDWAIAFIVAFFLYLLIECPFENLLRHLVDKMKGGKKGKHETEVVQKPEDVEMFPKNTEGNIILIKMKQDLTT